MQIILPRGVEQPRFRCTLCKKPFYKDEARAFERHVIRCADSHEAEIHEMSRDPLEGAGFDTEREEYVRRTGRTG